MKAEVEAHLALQGLKEEVTMVEVKPSTVFGNDGD
jgi:hypothetical protein